MKQVLMLIFVGTLVSIDGLKAQSGDSFALIELFTSQGCSSCPRADALLSDISQKAVAGDQNIYTLSFHVDYWNRLGWKDPYSKKSYTQRQYAYSKAFNNGNVYTPQMVVNGNVEFVGSDKQKAIQAINSALKQENNRQLAIELIRTADKELRVAYQLDQVPRNSVINLALVERGITTEVKRGENGGRTLHHDNVVRVFKSTLLENKSGEVVLELPENYNESNSAIIAYIQAEDLKSIYAAQKINFKAPVVRDMYQRN